MANFQQAIKWILQGNRVRRTNYPKGKYLDLDDNKELIIMVGGEGCKCGGFNLSIESLRSNDWEIYNPEKSEETRVAIKNLLDDLENTRFEVPLVHLTKDNDLLGYTANDTKKSCVKNLIQNGGYRPKKMIYLQDFYKLLEDKKREING